MNHSNPTPEARDLDAIAKGLHELLKETTHPDSDWAEAEYGALVRHQLNTPLMKDLAAFDANAAEMLKHTPVKTFGELLRHSDPPVEVLRLIRDFAKRLKRHAAEPYPEDVATVLYMACIAAAETRAGVNITRMSETDRTGGYRWALSLSWLPDELRELFTDAVNSINPH